MLCGWGVKAGMVRVWQVKLRDPLTSIGHPSTSEMRFFIIRHYTNRSYFTLLFTLWVGQFHCNEKSKHSALL